MESIKFLLGLLPQELLDERGGPFGVVQQVAETLRA
jgi:hypothetical protein